MIAFSAPAHCSIVCAFGCIWGANSRSLPRISKRRFSVSTDVGGVPISDALGQCGHPHDDDFRATIENEVRYANITIIEGIGASQYGIGMVCARIAEIVLRDERAVVPIGVYNSNPGVTLSLRRRHVALSVARMLARQ